MVGRVPAASLALALSCVVLLVPPAGAQGTSTLDLYGLRVGTEYQLGPKETPGHQPGAWGTGAPGNVYANTGRDWVFNGIEAFQSLRLDKSRTVDVHVVVGGGTGEAGQHNVGWELKAGQAVVATGAPKQVQFTGNLVDLTWSEAPALEEVPTGSTLSFRVYTSGVGVGIRVNLQDVPGWTRLSLPTLAVQETQRQVHHRTLTGAGLELEEAVTDLQTATVHYNWTTEATSGTLLLDATVGNGTVAVAVADGAGKSLLSRTFTASGSLEEEVADAAAGTWRITLDYTGFSGEVSLALAAGETPAPEETTTSGTTSASDTSSPGEQATSSSSTTGAASTKGTPLPALLAVGAVALALIARRR